MLSQETYIPFALIYICSKEIFYANFKSAMNLRQI